MSLRGDVSKRFRTPDGAGDDQERTCHCGGRPDVGSSAFPEAGDDQERTCHCGRAGRLIFPAMRRSRENEMILTELSIEELVAHETELREERRRRADDLRATARRIVAAAREALEAAETEAQELEAQAEALDGNVSAPRKDEVDELAAELESIPVDESPKAKRGRKPKGKKPARKPAKKAKAAKPVKEPGELNEYELKIIKAISKGALGTAAVAEKCGFEQPYTARALKKLVGLALAVKLGDKRATRYEAA